MQRKYILDGLFTFFFLVDIDESPLLQLCDLFHNYPGLYKWIQNNGSLHSKCDLKEGWIPNAIWEIIKNCLAHLLDKFTKTAKEFDQKQSSKDPLSASVVEKLNFYLTDVPEKIVIRPSYSEKRGIHIKRRNDFSILTKNANAEPKAKRRKSTEVEWMEDDSSDEDDSEYSYDEGGNDEQPVGRTFARVLSSAREDI